MFIHRKTTAVLSVVVLGVATSPVRADTASTEAILRECAHTGLVSGAHTPAELREAAANMPADAAEYTACPDEIDRELATLGSKDASLNGRCRPRPVGSRLGRRA